MNEREPVLFETSDDELLIGVYARQGRTLDDLPYTDEFEAIYAALVGDRSADEPMGHLDKAGVFHRLHNLRKAGKMPRLGRASSSPPRIEKAHEQLLVKLVEQAVGRMSFRDRLPYTTAFDELVVAFNQEAGLGLGPHEVWRVVAKLAK